MRRHPGGLRTCSGGQSLRARQVERILVIKLSALGDFVLALAAMRKIRQAHPKAHITLLTTPPFEALAKICPYFNAVDPGGRPQSFADWMVLRKRIKAAGYGRVYDLQTSSRSNRIFQMLRPGPPVWSGIAWGCALPHRNPLRNAMHTLERHADPLRSAGIWDDADTQHPHDGLLRAIRGAGAQRPFFAGGKWRPGNL